MSRDDELRNRVGRLADAAEIPELTLDDVEKRGRRRVNHQRILAVAAAFMLVVGAVGAVKLLDQNGSKELDVAGDEGEGAETGDGEDGGSDGSDQEGSDAESVSDDPTTTGELSRSELYADDSAFGYHDEGPGQILPWGDGFVNIRQVFEPSDASLRDLVPDIEERLGADLVARLTDSGFDFDGYGRAFMDRFYFSFEDDEEYAFELEEQLWSDPVIGEALNQVMQGGTFSPEASVSPDGENWTVVEGFATPGEQQYFGSISSDGRRLVSGEQIWDPDAQATTGIVISFTEDLLNWQSITLPISPPEVPAYVRADVNLGQVVAMDGGAYATTNTWSWVDLWSLFPADLVAELEGGGLGWEPGPDGISLVDYGAWEEAAEDQGEFAYPTTVPPPIGVYPEIGPEEIWNPPVVRVVPWSDLGLTWEEYQSYNYADNESSAAWLVGWDGSVTPATAPTESGCCTVIATDAGLLAQSWPNEGHYFEGDESLWEPQAPLLHFSPDGQTWTEVDGPLESGWYDSMAPVDGGVVVLGSQETRPVNGEYREPQQIIWLVSPDGSSWQEISIPGVDDSPHLWFNQTGGDGIAAVIDRAVYEDVEYVERPPLANLSAVVETDEYVLEIATDELGIPVVTVSDADGVVHTTSVQDWAIRWPGEIEEIIFGYGVANEDTDFAPLFEEHFDEFLDQLSEQAEALWASVGFEEPVYPEYFPDYWLIATTDGISWLVEDLPDPVGENYYNAVAGISGGLVTVSLGEEWVTYSLG